MTTGELADQFESMASALRRMPTVTYSVERAPALDGEAAIGAAVLWAYARDLLTMTNRETFNRSELLVMLDVISRDPDIFPPGVVEMVAEAAKEESV